MKKILFVFIALTCMSFATLAHADPFSIGATATNLGTNSWEFVYTVTNNSQGSGPGIGLDGFSVQVPISAVVTNIVDPATYSSGGYWGHGFSNSTSNPYYAMPALKSGYQWLWWWGYEPASVYPIGTTATFSFRADGVTVANSSDFAVTYWGPYTYSSVTAELVGPAPVPEPCTMLLLGSGLAGVAAFRRKFRRA